MHTSRPTLILAASISSLLAASPAAFGANWVGNTSADVNDVSNWNVNPSGQNIYFGILGNDGGPAPFRATLSSNLAFPVVDIQVARGGGPAIFNHTAGTAVTGAGNWFDVGTDGGNGTYNLANTAGTGGTLTGFAQGSGSVTAERFYVGGVEFGNAGGTGVMNVNTTGTVTANFRLIVGVRGGTGTFNMDSGTVNIGNDLTVGFETGSNGTFRMSGGTVNRTGGWTTFGRDSTSQGHFVMSGGTMNAAGTTIVGLNAATGTFTMTGGTYNNGGEMWIGNQGNAIGTATISAGTLNVGNWLAIGRDSSTGTLTINGTGLVQKTNTDGSLEITNGNSATASGTVNLDGGTLRVNNITGSGGGGSTALFYFNGGTLKPTVANGDFIGGNVVPLVKNGGAVIDTDGFNITIAKSLAPDGASTGGLTKLGAGTLTLSGTNSYTGMTTVSGGRLVVTGDNFSGTGATVNSGGELAFGNGGFSGMIDGSVSVASGGALSFNRQDDLTYSATVTGAGAINKNGPNVLTLGASTAGFTGTMNINSGALVLDTNQSASVAVNGGGRLVPLANATGTLTVGGLSLNTNSTTDFEFGPGPANDVIVTSNPGGLSFGSAFTLNFYDVAAATPFSTNGVYTLFDYTGSFSGSLTNLVIGNPVAGKGYALSNDVGTTSIRLTISTVTLSEWNAAGGGLWTVGSNWTAGVPNAQSAEAVFGAVIGGPSTIDMNGNKTVGKLTFDNANSYTIGGGGTLTLDNGATASTVTVNDTSLLGGTHFIDVPITATGNLSVTTAVGTSIQFSNLGGGNGLTTNGAGTVTLNGAGTYSTTTVNGGSLNVGNGGTTGSLGTGPVVLGSGTALNFNRSDAITVNNAISGGGAVTQNLGSLTYTGSATHTGPTTLNAGTFFQEGTINGTSSFDIENTATFRGSSSTTVAGPLLIANNAGGTASLDLLGTATASVSGNFNVAGGSGSTGTLNLNAGTQLTVTGASVSIGQSGDATLNINGGTFIATGGSGFYIGDTGNSTGTVNQTAGTLTRTNGWFSIGGGGSSQGTYNISGGSLSATGDFNVADVGSSKGTLNVSGTAQVTSTGTLFVGKNSGTNGFVNVSGGTINSRLFSIGGFAGSTGNGFVTVSGGAVNSSDELWVGQGTNSNGLMNLNGGIVSTNSWVAVGREGGTSSYGVLNVSGTGNIRMTAGNSRWFQIGALGGQGILNMTGGTVEATNGGDLRLSEGTTGYGQANLSGGLLKVDRIVDNGATSYLYLNGTNMQARISTTSYLQGLDTAIVGPGGAIFDTNGQNITVAQTLTGNTGDGVLTIPVADGGSGYPTQPIVKITGDGTGAAAVANVVGGVLTSITITNPGSGYIAGNTFVTLIDGGATVPATLGDPTVGANNNTGGLTKNGDGTLTITASNTYGGATTVNDGTLEFTASQTLNSLVIADGATVVLGGGGPAPGLAEAAGAPEMTASGVEVGSYAARVVPEPGAFGLLAAGALGVLGRRRRTPVKV